MQVSSLPTGYNMIGVPQRISNLSPEKRALLMQRLIEKQAPSASSAIRPRPDGPCPLSFAQEMLWLLDQLWPGHVAYNVPRAVRLIGNLNVQALYDSLNAIIARHETLRTRFTFDVDRPVQVVADSATIDLPQIDLSTWTPAEREAEVERLVKEEMLRPFDLARDLMVHGILIRLAEQEHILVLVLHHIASDGWSRGLFFEELAKFYESFCQGTAPTLPPLPIQYGDFAYWQRQWLQGAVLDEQLEYWKQQLGGAPPALELPTDRPRPPVQSFHGARERRLMPGSLLRELNALGQRSGTTLHMTVLAAFQVLLSRYSGQHDIVVGTPIAGRNRAELEGLIGFFSNALVLRSDLSENPTFDQLLQQVRATAVGAYAHQELPFEKLVMELRPQRDLSRAPLFQVMFSVGQGHARAVDLHLPGLQSIPLDTDRGTTKFDLTVGLGERAGGLNTSCEYATDLFDRPTITRMLENFETLLESIVADPSRRVAALPLLPAATRRQILMDWNNTELPAPDAECVPALFEAQVACAPDAPAVVYADTSLTYRELDDRASRLAFYLHARGVGPGCVVGLCLERSVDIVVAILGVLKAGGAYVAIDPTGPAGRLAFIVRDCHLSHIVTQSHLCPKLRDYADLLVPLDEAFLDQAILPARLPKPVPDDLAYIVYTSGSTGTPKGVPVTHGNLVNAYRGWERIYGLRENVTSHLQMASYTFDVFTGDFVRALCSGGKLVISPKDVLLSPAQLYDLMVRETVDAAEFVPAVLRYLVEHLERTGQRLEFMRLLVSGSDSWYMKEYKQVKALCGPATRIINSYGVSEATIDASYFEGDAMAYSDDQLVPIGRPFPNVRLYVLDSRLQPVPIGVVGELCVAGAGVAREYCNAPELSAAKFVADTFASDPSARLYRTGDLARFLPDGNIEFLGRDDTQVKIRGHRVDLGEVEATLAAHPAVRECAVILETSGREDKRLIAYLALGAMVAPSALRRYLEEKVPEYMIPAAYQFLDTLPLNANGKVDRQALEALGFTIEDPEREGLAPRDAVEAELVEIWGDLLQVPQIGVRDDFFELGGHSLLAVRLVAEIQRRFDRILPLSTLFQGATIEHLAEVIQAPSHPPATGVVALQPSGSKPPFFCLHGIGGEVLCFAKLASRFAPDYPFYALEAIGLDATRDPFEEMEAMASYYIQQIRAIQPHGPYYLGGFSSGGTVAFEMAQQLHQMGERVALVAILDSPCAKFNYRAVNWGPTFWRGLASNVYANLAYWITTFREMPVSQKLGLVHERVRLSRDTLRNFRQPAPQGDPKSQAQAFIAYLGDLPGLEDISQWPAHRLRIIEAEYKALRKYYPQPYPGKVTLLRARRQPLLCSYEPTKGWGRVSKGGVEVKSVPGSHRRIIEEPYVRELAAVLQRCIDAGADGRL